MRVSVRLPISMVAAAVLVLNLADAIFTLVYIRMGVAREGNPLMENALGRGPIGFMIVKLGLVSLCVLLLVRLCERNAAGRAPELALVGSALAYSSLVIYHLAAVPSLMGAAS
jgi:hypothetical protein